MGDSDGLNELRAKMEKTKKELTKGLDMNMDKIFGALKQLEFEKEKKTKLNKMSATMMMAKDKSIKIVFDDINDSEKFYGK